MEMRHETPKQHLEISLLWRWLIANILGGAIASVLEIHFQFLGTLVLAGIPIGFAQGFVLRSFMRQAWRWAIATALAWPLVNLFEVSLLQHPGDWLVQTLTATGLLWEVFWLNLVRMAVVLALVAIPQAWLLREQSRRSHAWRIAEEDVQQASQPSTQTPGKSWLWIVASFVGGALLGAIGATTCLWWCPAMQGSLLGLVLGATSWFGYALVTGVPLYWILVRRDDK